MTDLANIGTLLSIVAVAGGGLFFIGRLSGRFDGLEKKLAGMVAEHDRCTVYRGNAETVLFEKFAELSTKMTRVETLIETLLKDRQVERAERNADKAEMMEVRPG